MKIVLRNGMVVSENSILETDVVIDAGKIIQLGKYDGTFDEEIDCSSKYILPGLIDVHVHFRVPGQEYKEDFRTGSMAAAKGGVTTVFDMPNNQPPVLSLADMEKKRELAKGNFYVNYGFYMGYNGANLRDVLEVQNVPGVKVYHAHSTGNMGVSCEDVEKLIKAANKIVVVHAEDEECIAQNMENLKKSANGDLTVEAHSKIRASECATMSVQFITKIWDQYGGNLHVAHVSSAKELEVIREFRLKNSEDKILTCEVTPHHLFLSVEDYQRLGNLIRVNPPIREVEDTYACWKALKEGDIDIVATDHAPHTIEEKSKKYLEAPSGIPGVEMMLPLLLNVVNNEGLTLNEIVKFCSRRPAEIFKIPHKGLIKEGFDADLVVVDMDSAQKVSREDVVSKCGWSPYEGMNLKGWPIMTFVNGVIVYNQGKFAQEAAGREIQLHFSS